MENHIVNDFDLVATQTQEEFPREAMLVVVERQDIPAHLGQPMLAGILGGDGALALEFSGSCQRVVFPGIPGEILEKIQAMGVIMVAWTRQGEVVDEKWVNIRAPD